MNIKIFRTFKNGLILKFYCILNTFMRNYLNKQDKRAMNRIRKRNAELALLSDSNFQVNSGLEEVKKVKLMKGKEHGDDDQGLLNFMIFIF